MLFARIGTAVALSLSLSPLAFAASDFSGLWYGTGSGHSTGVSEAFCEAAYVIEMTDDTLRFGTSSNWGCRAESSSFLSNYGMKQPLTLQAGQIFKDGVLIGSYTDDVIDFALGRTTHRLAFVDASHSQLSMHVDFQSADGRMQRVGEILMSKSPEEFAWGGYWTGEGPGLFDLQPTDSCNASFVLARMGDQLIVQATSYYACQSGADIVSTLWHRDTGSERYTMSNGKLYKDGVPRGTYSDNRITIASRQTYDACHSTQMTWDLVGESILFSVLAQCQVHSAVMQNIKLLKTP